MKIHVDLGRKVKVSGEFLGLLRDERDDVWIVYKQKGLGLYLQMAHPGSVEIVDEKE